MTGDEHLKQLWPEWCGDHPWLVSFLGAVEEEARNFGQRQIHIFHVLVAWSRSEVHPHWFSPDAAAMSPTAWLEFNVFKVGIEAGMDRAEFDRLPTPGCDPVAVESDVVEKLEVAREEAARHDSGVDARHFAVALGHPNWMNQARAALGLPTSRQVLAAGRDRGRTFVPSTPITAILCAGETGAALRHAVEIAPRPGVVMFRWWHHRHGGAGEREVALVTSEAGSEPVVVDPAHVGAGHLAAVERAGVVYLPGGWAEQSFEALVDTPLLAAISSCIENGGILVGNSGGAMVLGAGRLSSWESGDEPERLPLFGWLDGLVIGVHIRRKRLDRELRAGLTAFPGPGLLGVGQRSSVIVNTRPLRLSALENAPGNESVFLQSPEGEPEIVQPGG